MSKTTNKKSKAQYSLAVYRRMLRDTILWTLHRDKCFRHPADYLREAGHSSDAVAWFAGVSSAEGDIVIVDGAPDFYGADGTIRIGSTPEAIKQLIQALAEEHAQSGINHTSDITEMVLCATAPERLLRQQGANENTQMVVKTPRELQKGAVAPYAAQWVPAHSQYEVRDRHWSSMDGINWTCWDRYRDELVEAIILLVGGPRHKEVVW